MKGEGRLRGWLVKPVEILKAERGVDLSKGWTIVR